MLDLLLTHAWYLALDPHEQQIMRPFPPLGLQYLVAWLRREGWHAVDWWDASFAPGPDTFAAVLADTDPRVVGFYGHTITRPVAAGMVRRCVEQGRRIIVGGPDPAQSAEEWFTLGAEVLVLGEGERTLQELMEHLRRNRWAWNPDELACINGIAFKQGETVVRTPQRALLRPLDQLPWPAREHRDLDAYARAWRERHGRTALSMSTSRGCPYHCAWCSKQVYGDTFRRRSVEGVLDELDAVRREYQPDEVWFVDDMFTINRRWVDEFCTRKVERRVDVPFYVIGRGETIDTTLARALRRAGCARMFLSAESGADPVLDRMKKGTSVAEVEQAAALLHAEGIEVGVFVMLGYPGESKADILATRDMLRRMRPEVTLLSLAHPMKGTAFHDEVKDRITGEVGGRLTFTMPYSPRLYRVAERMLWADRDRADSWKARLRYTLWRAAFAATR